MLRTRVAAGFCLLLFALALGAGCKNSSSRIAVEPPPEDFQANEIGYVDNDAFDAIFETALISQDPVIVIHTGNNKPDWGLRLNAWIAAWNMGGRVDDRTARGQAPLPSIVVDGDSIREFRLLVGGLMDRVEGLAREGSAWWAEERTRSRRIALLKPYNLRFHMDDDETIRLIFFNGQYARYYPGYMRTVTRAHDDELEPWTRTYDCSHCRRQWKDKVGQLTGTSAD